jgi:predicted phage terminase large subunit-like protein
MNVIFQRRVLDAATRNDFMCFLWMVYQTIDPAADYKPNWHYEAFFEIAQDLINRKAGKKAICAPPRSGKSIFFVALAAWIMGHDPTRKIICISYSKELAAKFSNDFRRVVKSDWYRRAFPHTVVADWKDTEAETHFTAGGFRLGTSIGGQATGRGGDHVLFDDPIKLQDAHYDTRREWVNRNLLNACVSRLNDRLRGSVLGCMQRVHFLDVVGVLPPDYEIHNFPAIAMEDERISLGGGRYHRRKTGEALHPEREPVSLLLQIKEDIGDEEYQSQWQQMPVPPGGLLVKREWIYYYDDLPPGGYYFHSWDTAGKTGPRNSYSVCTVWYRKGSIRYLVDVIRGRFDFPTLRDTAIELVKRYKPRVVLIEEASTGIALDADLRRAAACTVKLLPVVGDKIGRLYAVTGKFASRNVQFPRHAPFMSDLLEELLRFPQSKFTDQVDSISQALAYEGSTYTLDYVS